MERPGIGHHRQDRQRRQTPEQRAAAISRRPEHDRRAQDHPIEIAAHQRLVALPLGARKLGRRLAVDADRRQVDNPPDAGAFAGREQRADAVGMHAARRVGGESCRTPAQLTTASMPARQAASPRALSRRRCRATPIPLAAESGAPAPCSGRAREPHAPHREAGRPQPSRSGRSPRSPVPASRAQRRDGGKSLPFNLCDGAARYKLECVDIRAEQAGDRDQSMVAASLSRFAP